MVFYHILTFTLVHKKEFSVRYIKGYLIFDSKSGLFIIVQNYKFNIERFENLKNFHNISPLLNNTTSNMYVLVVYNTFYKLSKLHK